MIRIDIKMIDYSSFEGTLYDDCLPEYIIKALRLAQLGDYADELLITGNFHLINDVDHNKITIELDEVLLHNDSAILDLLSLLTPKEISLIEQQIFNMGI